MNSVFIRYWLPSLGWAAFIFGVSSIPSIPSPPSLEGIPWDKVPHAIVYAILAGLLFRAFRGAEQFSVCRSGWLAILFAVAYAFSDESHQYFVGRSCEWTDLAADFVGATIMVSVFVGRSLRIGPKQPIRNTGGNS